MPILTTSGTYVVQQSVAQLIAGSMRLCGAIADEETPTAPMMLNSVDTLNALIKGWSASGIHVWCENEAILFCNPGQAQYKLGPGSPDNACLFENLNTSALTVTAAASATSVTLASVAGILSGDIFGVQLDSGVNFWTTVSGTPTGLVVPLTSALPSQATSGALTFDYTTPLMRPLRVLEGRRYLVASSQEIPMIPLSRFDYDYLPNKSNTGTPTQFFFDSQMGNGAYSPAAPLALMNLWPAPQDNTSTMRFVAQRQIQDITSIGQYADFPAEWLAALRWNLAVEMAPEFDVPADRFDRLQAKAAEWFLRASAWDKEPESLLCGYATQQTYRT